MHRLSYPPAPQQARALDGGQASYNQLVERLVAYRALLEEHDAVDNPAAVPTSSLALPRPSDDQAAQRRHWLLRDGPVIEEFLATTAGQLTVCGLAQLHEEMGKGSWRRSSATTTSPSCTSAPAASSCWRPMKGSSMSRTPCGSGSTSRPAMSNTWMASSGRSRCPMQLHTSSPGPRRQQQ